MSNFNENSINYTPIMPNTIIDEVSSEEYYIGKSINGKTTTASVWQIEKISKNGTIWNFEFPEGSQEYKFAWSERATYTYK